MRVNGNLYGIKDSYLEVLDSLYDMECSIDEIISLNILEIIVDITQKIGKEISVFLNRRGKVLDVSVGDSSSVHLPELDLRRGSKRLSGVRCVHTHPETSGCLSAVDISALLGLRMDALAAVGVKNGKIENIYIGYLVPEDGELKGRYEIQGPLSVNDLFSINMLDAVRQIEKELKQINVEETDKEEKERVLLVGLSLPSGEGSNEDLIDELEELAKAANAEVLGKILQKKNKVDPASYIGSGKAKELALIKQAVDVDTIIFDDELSGAQVRNLEEITGAKVIDRTTLILDIFASRAQTKEGKLQVELAQLKYRLPRLIGLGKVLSRTGGGIGTKGPGEKKLEIDRRHIRERINELEKELEEVKKNRNIQRYKRRTSKIPIISLVGYTNSGKSTMRNTLSRMYQSDVSTAKDEVYAADMLFATLDITTRLIKLPKGQEVLVSDTVGFIRKLPHDLVDAFRATLEEIVYSDILIHVVDSSAYNAKEQINAVNAVLKQLNICDKPVIIALNKIDKVKNKDIINLFRANLEDVVEVSALYGDGIADMISLIEKKLFNDYKTVKLNIPYDKMGMKYHIYKECRVISEEYGEDGLYITAEMDDEKLNTYRNYVTFIE